MYGMYGMVEDGRPLSYVGALLSNWLCFTVNVKIKALVPSPWEWGPTWQTLIFTYLLRLLNKSILKQTHWFNWERILQQQNMVDNYKWKKLRRIEKNKRRRRITWQSYYIIPLSPTVWPLCHSLTTLISSCSSSDVIRACFGMVKGGTFYPQASLILPNREGGN